MSLEVSELTDEELAFLLYAAQEEAASVMRSATENDPDETYTVAFRGVAESLTELLETEYDERGLELEQFYLTSK